ncbi:MAG: COX15/CtaA family protein [Proteobacteria bacterium]|nr:COX15/CtaA family protein [Pseudomonadota bacterium]
MHQHQKAVTIWLFCCCAMVVVMMLVGAATRLTESGLSMVEWRPLVGWIPPLSEAEWRRVFDLYRQTSEYRLQHAGMGLGSFQKIFWWEYAHRLWGRLIGIVFAAPFLWFLYRRALNRALLPHLAGLFLLGGVQGLIGWWMVQSGFVNRADVSQYRLVAHLAMAVGILGYLLWLALGRVMAPDHPVQRAEKTPVWVILPAWVILCVIVLTIVSGGFVAGLNAGLIYNTWPSMDGGFLPNAYGDLRPWWRNLFENVATVQFNHRLAAYGTFVSVLWFFWTARRKGSDERIRKIATAALVVVCVQLLLGITTLLLVVPISLAVLHQLGAITLFCLSVASLRLLYGTKARLDRQGAAQP